MASPGTYLPNREDKRIFGLDLSSNQSKIDFDKMRSCDPAPQFLIFRTGISWGYKDKFFPLYWVEAGKRKFLRASYHVLYPLEPIASQVKNCISMFPDKDFGEGPIVNDVELVHGASKRQLSNAADAFSKGLEDATGKEVLIYSRFSFVKAYMEYQAWMEKRRWIMAIYVDGIKHPPIREWDGGPNVEKGFEKLPVAMLQTGEKGDGQYYGCSSHQVDTDRWLLSEIEFMKSFGLANSSPAPVPAPLTLEQRVERLEVAVQGAGISLAR